MDDKSLPRSLWSFEFIAMMLIIVAAFGNVSAFYSFYHYLGVIDIPVAWRGFLLGLEPMTAFILRLFVLPWLHMKNAMAVTTLSLILLIVTSWAYLWVTTVAAMIVLRIVHGAVFVLLTSSVIALIVNFIPKEKSGQGFAALTIATMIPYALIPPLSESLLPYVNSEATIYAGVSSFSMIAIVFLIALRRRIGGVLAGMEGALMRRPSFSEIRENFRIHAVVTLLGAFFLIYLAHATFFYFMKDLSLQTGMGNVGLFFTISMAAMIAMRVFGVMLFDRIKKLPLLKTGLALLVPCIIMLPNVGSSLSYYLLAGLYGLCLGVILPLLNALLFLASPPPLRGLNTNMTLFMMDAGYFLTPFAGGAVIAWGAEFGTLFYIAAGFTLLSLALVATMSNIEHNH